MPTTVYGLNGFDEGGAPIIGGTVTPQARPARGGMIMDEGGGGSEIVEGIEVVVVGGGGTGIGGMEPEFNNNMLRYSLSYEGSEEVASMGVVVALNGVGTVTARTSKGVTVPLVEDGAYVGNIAFADFGTYFNTATIGGQEFYTGTLVIMVTEEGASTPATYEIGISIINNGGPK